MESARPLLLWCLDSAAQCAVWDAQLAAWRAGARRRISSYGLCRLRRRAGDGL